MNFEDLKQLKFQKLEDLLFDRNDLNSIKKEDVFPNFNKYLKHLSAASCKLTYNGLEAITKLPLEDLDISYNCFYKEEDKTVEDLKEATTSLLLDQYNFNGISTWISKIKKNWGKSYGKISNIINKSRNDDDWRNSYSRIIRFYGLKTKSSDTNLKWLRDSDVGEDFDMRKLKNSLVNLKMNLCNLTPKVLSYFIKDLKKLKTLDIYGNNLQNIDKEHSLFSLSDTLTYLNVGWCNLNSDCLLYFRKLKNLTDLNISDNDLSNLGELFKTIKNLKSHKIPNIAVLDVSFSYLDESGMEFLSHIFSNLNILNVSRNKLTKELKLSKAWKSSLEDLKMAQCGLSKSVLNEVMNLAKLKSLEIESNEFSLMSLDKIEGAAVKSLRKLKIDGFASSEQFDLSKITRFNLTDLCISHFVLVDLCVANYEKLKRNRSEQYKSLTNTLENIEMNHCIVDEKFIHFPGKIENLRKIKLNFVKLNHISSYCFESPNFKNLKILDSIGSNFSLETIKELLKLDYTVLYMFRHWTIE